MKILFKMRYVPALLFVFLIAPAAHAATTPSLGAAASYGILSNTFTNPTGPTTVTGDVGYTTGPVVPAAGVHTNVGSGAPYAQAGVDQAAALVNLNSQPCTFTFVAPAVVLDTTLEHPTTYAPGVYCSTGAMSVGTAGGITLSGAGTYIFRSGGALNMVAGATVNLALGASACDVFWTPNGATTLNANSIFVGTVIPVSQDITVLSTTNWVGRALTYGHTVTTPDSNVVISTPAGCSAPVVGTTSPIPPLINVRKVPSPLALTAGPGPVTYNYTVTNPGKVPMHSVTLVDDQCSAVTFLSGDTNGDSQLDINETWLYSCATTLSQTTVNYATARGLANDMAAVDTAIAQVIVGVPVIPPLIHIVKTPSPLSLLAGGGNVTYSYAVTNPGTVALTDVTVTDDKCTTVTRVSGDMNSDSKLQSNETWNYTCTANLALTTVNTAVATGHANGLTAIDTALATVVVAAATPVVPPLIHVIKKANPIILPAAGGWVDYSYSVTNPGTVPLNSVTLVDDKCTGVTRVTGDDNANALLDVNETWTYTCRKYISYTTLNTATAQGSANGLTVTDLAIANVAVAPALIPPAPKLPNTGFDPGDAKAAWIVAAAGIFVAGTLLFALSKRKSLSK